MNIAHILTLGRLLLSPIFLLVYLNYAEWGIPLQFLPYLLITLLAISELSDLFDGFLARRLNQVTEIGKLIDPMADSIFRLTVFLSFTQGIIQLPLIVVSLFFYRDLIISTLRTVCALRGVTLAARMSGKIKAVVQGICAFFIILLMIPYSLGFMELELLQSLSLWATVVTATYTLFSGVEYLYANRLYIKKAF